MEEHLGRAVPAELTFRDQNGDTVRLGDYWKDGKTVMLTLNYFECPMLCSIQLNKLVEGLRELSWTIGEDFRIVTVSIDSTEKPKLAKAKRATYLKELGRPEADWNFLTGDDASIRALADAVGFRFHWVEETKQFAHPAVVFVLSPDGVVARYIYGIEYPARDLKFALVEASEGRLGSPVDKFFLSCFHYDSTVGAYGPWAMGIMRAAGVVSMLVLSVVLTALWRRDLARRARRS
ncbi:MAG: SCO family protein [Deltaproteobacteria bacterium]|nr:SCO family protein [Deltaproteobacteria bacterium]